MLNIKKVHNKKYKAAVTVAAVLMLGLTVTPWLGSQVSARQGADDGAITPSSTTMSQSGDDRAKAAGSSSSGSSDSGSGSNAKKTETEVHRSTESNSPATGQTEAHKSMDTGTTAAEDRTHGKLESAKLRVCKNHENTIDSVMGRVSERGQKQLDLYTAIAGRVEKFYVNKGQVLGNYDSLVATVNTQKTIAQTAVDKLAADKVNFKCDGADPKGDAGNFKADQKGVADALKTYRTSIKALIQGVKSVQPDTVKTTAPSTTPPATIPQGSQQ